MVKLDMSALLIALVLVNPKLTVGSNTTTTSTMTTITDTVTEINSTAPIATSGTTTVGFILSKHEKSEDGWIAGIVLFCVLGFIFLIYIQPVYLFQRCVEKYYDSKSFDPEAQAPVKAKSEARRRRIDTRKMVSKPAVTVTDEEGGEANVNPVYLAYEQEQQTEGKPDENMDADANQENEKATPNVEEKGEEDLEKDKQLTLTKDGRGVQMMSVKRKNPLFETSQQNNDDDDYE
eukprot:m.16674 g.16674  ORF g.16674 m.16674 type:complete len:234 (-) comp5764_c0_seq2:1530-2231(-)